MKAVEKNARVVVDPTGRVDILLSRLAEFATRNLVNPYVGVDAWPHFAPVVEAKIQQLRIPRRKMSLLEIAQRVGFLKRRRIRK